MNSNEIKTLEELVRARNKNNPNIFPALTSEEIEELKSEGFVETAALLTPIPGDMDKFKKRLKEISERWKLKIVKAE